MAKRVKDISDSLSELKDISHAHTSDLIEYNDQILRLDSETTKLLEDFESLSIKLTITQRISIIACSLSGLGLGVSVISLLV